MRHNPLLFAFLLTVASIQHAEAGPCGLLDNSSAALSTLARGWHEDWPVERLEALWGRKPDRLVQDISGTLDRVLWSEGSFDGVGCSVSVNVGSGAERRAIDLTVTGIETIQEAVERASTIARTVGVPEQPRVLRDLQRAAGANAHWHRDYEWDHPQQRDAAEGGLTTFEVHFDRSAGRWRVVCHYVRIIPPTPGAD